MPTSIKKWRSSSGFSYPASKFTNTRHQAVNDEKTRLCKSERRVVSLIVLKQLLFVWNVVIVDYQRVLRLLNRIHRSSTLWLLKSSLNHLLWLRVKITFISQVFVSSSSDLYLFCYFKTSPLLLTCHYATFMFGGSCVCV